MINAKWRTAIAAGAFTAATLLAVPTSAHAAAPAACSAPTGQHCLAIDAGYTSYHSVFVSYTAQHRYDNGSDYVNIGCLRLTTGQRTYFYTKFVPESDVNNRVTVNTFATTSSNCSGEVHLRGNDVDAGYPTRYFYLSPSQM